MVNLRVVMVCSIVATLPVVFRCCDLCRRVHVLRGPVFETGARQAHSCALARAFLIEIAERDTQISIVGGP